MARKKANPTLTERMAAVEGEVESLTTRVAELTTSLNSILGSLQGMEKWIPAVDEGIKDLRQAVEQVASRVTTLEAKAPATTMPVTIPPVGHGAALNHQGAATGTPVDQGRALVKGKLQFHNSPVHFDLGDCSEKGMGGLQSPGRSSGSRLPKTDFPKFDGDNPKLWKTNSEKYFSMYQVPYETWSSFATLHFVGNAALWLQTYEELHCVESWPELCVVVHGKFGKDKYQQHLEELEGLSQVGGVDEYYTKFEELMHKVLVYNKRYDETFFVTRFMGGLKTEIKTTIKLHKPRTVDLTLSLAKTQEELLLESSRKNYSKEGYKDAYKPVIKPVYQGKGILGASPEEAKKPEEKPKWEERFDTLKAARRARGECFKCGEKYGLGHKCPKSVQLHVLEELLEVLQLQEDGSQGDDEEEHKSDEELVLSEFAVAGTMGRKTIRFHGMIQKQQLLILLDSGSSSNFLAENVVNKLGLQCETVPATQVTIADGGKMQCNQLVSGVEWWCQGHTFTIDFKVLNLGGYDMILGMEWLESFSPMWIDWRRKRIRFTYMGDRVSLNGVKPNLSQTTMLSVKQLKGLHKDGAISQMVQLCAIEEVPDIKQELPAAVELVVKEFQDRFKKPTELPPHRQFHHHIPLLPTAKSVTKKPYRYAPQQKDEIEQQVVQMLQQGIIQASSSPFASQCCW